MINWKTLTDGVENDTALKNQNSDGLGREARCSARVSSNLGHHEALAEILDQERDEDASHDDSGCGALIAQLSQTLVGEHELRVGVQMDKGSRDDDTSAKLLENEEKGVRLGRHPLDHEDWEVDTKSAGNQDDEQKADAQRDVVVARNLGTASRAAALALTGSNTVLNTGVKVAVLALRRFAFTVGIRGLGTLCDDFDVVAVGGDAVGVGTVRVAVGKCSRDGRSGGVGGRRHDLILGSTPHAEAEAVSYAVFKMEGSRHTQ